MNQKMAILLLLAGLMGSVLPGCGSPTSGVPEASQSEREKYKEIRAKATAEAAAADLEAPAADLEADG